MDPPTLALDDEGRVDFAPSPAPGALGAGDARMRAIQHEHFEFVWRSVRRLGVPDADADDAVQQVFIVTSRRLETIPDGSERAFLFGTAIRVASHARRAIRRRGEVSLQEGSAPGEPTAKPSEPRAP